MTTLLRSGLLAFALFFAAGAVMAQGPPSDARAYLGEWRTIDDETGEAKSIVQIYEQDGQVFGRIVRLLPTRENPRGVCVDCAARFDGRDLRGEVIIRDMTWNASNNRFEGGRILDPKSGREYRSWMQIQTPGELTVRGFVSILGARVGRSQTWHRAN
jgi:uncharacterized protein (DUF2147 family)